MGDSDYYFMLGIITFGFWTISQHDTLKTLTVVFIVFSIILLVNDLLGTQSKSKAKVKK